MSKANNKEDDRCANNMKKIHCVLHDYSSGSENTEYLHFYYNLHVTLSMQWIPSHTSSKKKASLKPSDSRKVKRLFTTHCCSSTRSIHSSLNSHIQNDIYDDLNQFFVYCFRRNLVLLTRNSVVDDNLWCVQL